jgi:hypothetical protein
LRYSVAKIVKTGQSGMLKNKTFTCAEGSTFGNSSFILCQKTCRPIVTRHEAGNTKIYGLKNGNENCKRVCK